MPSNPKREKVYGVADKAWQPVVGCDPHMPCAPRCWARKTVARVVECQTPVNPDRAEFFQIALTPDRQKWSGEVLLDEAHLLDPLKWCKPAVVAAGFHGDIGRLNREDMSRLFSVIAYCQMFETVYPSKFLLLTKQPAHVYEYLSDDPAELSIDWSTAAGEMLDGQWIWNEGKRHRDRIEAFISACMGFYPDGENMLEEDAFPIPLPNVNVGCSVMNQAEADKYREPMAQIAALGWNTHVWYEPAIGAVDWSGWEFLRGMISGGESGANSRPSHPQWHRDTRDWCAKSSVPFHFKQWGDWAPALLETVGGSINRSNGKYHYAFNERGSMMRLGKARTGRLLDGVTHDAVPAFGEARG